jgi:hypothetical protein
MKSPRYGPAYLRLLGPPAVLFRFASPRQSLVLKAPTLSRNQRRLPPRPGLAAPHRNPKPSDRPMAVGTVETVGVACAGALPPTLISAFPAPPPKDQDETVFCAVGAGGLALSGEWRLVCGILPPCSTQTATIRVFRLRGAPFTLSNDSREKPNFFSAASATVHAVVKPHADREISGEPGASVIDRSSTAFREHRSSNSAPQQGERKCPICTPQLRLHPFPPDHVQCSNYTI